LDVLMTTLTPTIITEAAAALSVSPWVFGPMSDRFGHDQALVERWMR
jgi:hypothetical protein